MVCGRDLSVVHLVSAAASRCKAIGGEDMKDAILDRLCMSVLRTTIM